MKKKSNYIGRMVAIKINNKLKKVVIWRVLSFIVASSISYFYLGELRSSLELAIILTIVMTTIHYFYEGVWEDQKHPLNK